MKFHRFLLLLVFSTFFLYNDSLQADGNLSILKTPPAKVDMGVTRDVDKVQILSNTTDVEVIDVPELEQLIKDKESNIRVINFWATWCGPCVKELPFFEKINKDPRFDNVEVILVSVDFIEDLDSKVKKFIEKRNIQSRVMLIDNTDYNSWIDKVDPSWSGAIPATLILNSQTGERRFFEKSFEEGELEKILIEF